MRRVAQFAEKILEAGRKTPSFLSMLVGSGRIGTMGSADACLAAGARE